MNDSSSTQIGKIYDAHGIRGDVVVLVFSGDISWINEVKDLDLVLDGKTKRHKILKARPHKKGFVCQLEGFTDRNQSEAVIGSEVWIDSSYFTSQEGDAIFLKEIFQFEVIDSTDGSIGNIEAFSFNGIQDLLVIVHPETKKQYEIPFVKEFVEKLDQKNKKIFMNLPPGLLSINESEE